MAHRILKTPSHTPAQPVAFIDLEASGLGARSWPVEVGWAFAEGQPRSLLVRPDDSWRDDAWDPRAEALHGLGRRELEREGLPIKDVCAALNAALEGVDVYSDALDWDAFWLYRLFSTAGVRQGFALQDFGVLLDRLQVTNDAAILERAERIAPRRHRAAADALHLQTLYRLAATDCGPQLTR